MGAVDLLQAVFGAWKGLPVTYTSMSLQAPYAELFPLLGSPTRAIRQPHESGTTNRQ
jgi:hypothetical protein